MSFDIIRLKPDGTFENRWDNDYSSNIISFQVTISKFGLDFNLDEPESSEIREYGYISGKVLQVHPQLHIKDSESENTIENKSIGLKRLIFNNTNVQISEASNIKTPTLHIDKFEDELYLLILISDDIMKKLINKIFSDETIVTIDATFKDSYLDRYADGHEDVYLERTINEAEIKSININSNVNKQEKVIDIHETILNQNDKLTELLNKAMELDDKRHFAEMKQSWLNQGVTVLSTILIIATIIISNIYIR